jgi:hypothetical protein
VRSRVLSRRHLHPRNIRRQPMRTPNPRGPRQPRYLQREVVGFRRPLALYGCAEHGREVPFSSIWSASPTRSG